jgi:hypothetical protein
MGWLTRAVKSGSDYRVCRKSLNVQQSVGHSFMSQIYYRSESYSYIILAI